MAKRSYYHRSFIILKAISKGYGFLPNKEPSGYCKFEIRRGVGKAYIYLQDIRPSSISDGIYEAYLISLDDSIKPCKLASLHIEEQGRGENTTSFDADDIRGSGYSLDNFHALVIAYRSGKEGEDVSLAYPLIGYSSRDISIDTHRITESLKSIYGEGIKMESDPEPKVDFIPEEEGEPTIEPESEPEIRAEPEAEPKPRIGADPEPEAEPEPEIGAEQATELDPEPEAEPEPELEAEPKPEPEAELKPGMEIGRGLEMGARTEEQLETQLEPTEQSDYLDPKDEEPGDDLHYDPEESDGEKPDESNDGLRHAYETSYQEYMEDFDHQEEEQDGPGSREVTTYWDNVGDYFLDLFKTNEGVEPFDNDLKNVQWIRTQRTFSASGKLYAEGPYGYPYYNNSYPDHYLVGLFKEDGYVKYVIYGIPSMYSMIPPISINGFSRWAPIKGAHGMGYWLLYVDAISGRVVYPHEKE